MSNLSAQIEAILFFKSEPVEKRWLAKTLNTGGQEIETALEKLKEELSGHGLVLLEKDDSVMLGTAPEASPLIESLIKEELSRDLGKAGLETLAIVLYEGPLTRADIDYVRGVNSSFILRHLLVRGLVERLPKPGDARTFLYGPTFQLLQYLGATKVENLTEYAKIRQELSAFKELKTDQINNDQFETITTTNSTPSTST